MFSNNNRISTRQVFRLFVFDFVGESTLEELFLRNGPTSRHSWEMTVWHPLCWAALWEACICGILHMF